MTLGEGILAALEQHTVLLAEIRDELRSWKAAVPADAPCPHPPELQQDLSSMGEKWIRCRGCKADLVREGSAS